MSLVCNGIVKRTNCPCTYVASVYCPNDTMFYCKYHLPGRVRTRPPPPRSSSVSNSLRTVGFLICSGVTKRGVSCKGWGYKNHNGRPYCRHHIPNDYVEILEEDVRPIVQYGNIGVDPNDDCPICFKTLATETIVKTNCGHAFHKSCIDTWLSRHETCPLCRTATHIKRGPCPTRRIEVVEY